MRLQIILAELMILPALIISAEPAQASFSDGTTKASIKIPKKCTALRNKKKIKKCYNKYMSRRSKNTSTSPILSVKPAASSINWSIIFNEDFNTDAQLGSFLTTYKNFKDYPSNYTDTSRNYRSDPGHYVTAKTVSVKSSILNTNLHYDTVSGQYVVAALKPVLPVMLYGKFSIRLRADVIPGYKIAPLLWPDSEIWPAGGEIDFPEGDLNGKSFSAFAHYANSAGGQDYFNSNVDPTQWHTYDIAWSPGKIEFYVDGRLIGTSTKYVPNTPMHWVLQMETQISSVSPSKSVSGNVQIDWVKVYKLT